jgi:hypothetical protein
MLPTLLIGVVLIFVGAKLAAGTARRDVTEGT